MSDERWYQMDYEVDQGSSSVELDINDFDDEMDDGEIMAIIENMVDEDFSSSCSAYADSSDLKDAVAWVHEQLAAQKEDVEKEA